MAHRRKKPSARQPVATTQIARKVAVGVKASHFGFNAAPQLYLEHLREAEVLT